MIEPDHEKPMVSLRHAAGQLTTNRSIRDQELVLDDIVPSAADAVPVADGGGVSRTARGVVSSNHADHLGQALTSRDVVGQAKSILMERFSVHEDGAFPMLMRSSPDTNVKLVDVARWLASQATSHHTAGQQPPAAT